MITIAGSHLVASRGHPLECVFGGDSKVDAMLVSSEEALCVSPASEHGPVSLTLEVRGLGGVQSEASVFMYDRALAVQSLEPSRGIAAQDLTITVAGEPFLSERTLLCVFGGTHRSRGTIISSTQLSCKVPSVLVGNSTVEVEFEGGASAPAFAGIFQSDEQVRLGDLSPSSGPTRGGTRVRIPLPPRSAVAGSDTIECMFGQVLVIGEVEADAGACISPPVASAGMDLVHVQNRNESLGSAEFEFVEPEALLKVVPSTGPIHGGTMEVVGSGFRPSRQLSCAYVDTGMIPVPALWRTSSRVTCHMPPQETEDVGSLEISNNGQDFTSGGVSFAYERAPTVVSVSLAEARDKDGLRGILRVQGAHFMPSQELKCSTGIAQEYVSSSLIHCRIEAAAYGSNVTVEVSNNGQDFSTNGVGFSAMPVEYRPTTLLPSSGPSRGGTRVTVSGGDWLHVAYAVCIFGDSLPVEAQVMDDGRLECVAAAAMRAAPHQATPAAVEVRVIVDGEEVSAGSELWFEYAAPADVTGIVPSAGAVEGSTMV